MNTHIQRNLTEYIGHEVIEARLFETKLRDGNILISVHSDTSEETSRARDIFRRAGATDISDSGEEPLKKAA